MKRVMRFCLAFILLYGMLSLAACKQKGMQVVPFTYTGEIRVDQSSKSGSPLENVSNMVGWYDYTINYDLQHPVQDDAAEPTKEMVFRGRSYPLTYKETIRRADGEAYHVYVLKFEDIDEAVFDNNPTLQRTLFIQELTALKVDAKTGRILTIANLPDAPCWFEGVPTEDELRAAAVELARPFTDMPFEEYTFSCRSIYHTVGPDYNEGHVIDGVQSEYPNEQYYVEFRCQIADKPIAQRVIVKFYASHVPTVVFCYTDLTDEEQTKIEAFDEAAMREQATAYVREHLKKGTELQGVTFSDEQFDKEDGKLWWNIGMTLRIGEKGQEGLIIPVTLRMEVI